MGEVIGMRVPIVGMYSSPKEPLFNIWLAWNNMHAQVLPHGGDTREEHVQAFTEVIEHQHKTSLEFCQFVFGINASRAFQQQITRHRVGISFSIQSLRQVPLTKVMHFMYPPDLFPDQEKEFEAYMIQIQNKYCKLIDDGWKIEDARGILPLNVCSNITMAINYRSIFEMANQRLCETTQQEFKDVMASIKDLITKTEPLMGLALKPRCEYTKSCNQGRWSCGNYPTQ